MELTLGYFTKDPGALQASASSGLNDPPPRKILPAIVWLNLFQLLNADLFYLWLPDLVRHPGRRSFGLLYLNSLAGEYMNFLGAAFPEPDIRVTSVGSLKGCLPRLLSRKDPYLIPLFISEGEVPSFNQFFSLHSLQIKQHYILFITMPNTIILILSRRQGHHEDFYYY